jgi:hypothetical protein
MAGGGVGRAWQPGDTSGLAYVEAEVEYPGDIPHVTIDRTWNVAVDGGWVLDEVRQSHMSGGAESGMMEGVKHSQWEHMILYQQGAVVCCR